MEKKKTLMSAILLLFFCLLGGGSLITGEPYELWFWIIGIVVFGIIFAIIDSKNKEERQEKIKEAMSSIDNFEASFKITDTDARYVFAIDNVRKKVMILTVDNSDSQVKKNYINFADIISVELLEDSNLSFSKSTIRTIGGGLVGGAVAGGAGAIIGGLSGDSKVKKKISRIQVKILVRNHNVPSYIVDCFIGAETELGNLSCEMGNAKKIIDHISVIIDMMDREYQQELSVTTSKAETVSIADELEKLCLLKEKGILSDEEFQKQKEKILS